MHRKQVSHMKFDVELLSEFSEKALDCDKEDEVSDAFRSFLELFFIFFWLLIETCSFIYF
jgi:hypothetical protein